jgi:membrane fusion protein, multidrug efflux system
MMRFIHSISHLAGRGGSRQSRNTQAKAPAPPLWLESLRASLGRAFSLRAFCYGLLAVVMILAGCSKHQVAVTQSAAPVAARVRAVRVETQPFTASLSVTGSLVSRSLVELKAETTGRVVRFDKEEGDPVKAGEVIIWVDDEKPRLAVREAASAVEVADAVCARARVADAYNKSELERARNLLASGGITDKDLNAARVAAQDSRAQVSLAEAQLAQAKAALASAQRRLADGQVKAPVGGEISRKLINKGAYVEPTTPVVTLVDNQRLELESPVPASDLGGVRPGQMVRFNVNSYPGESFTGRVVDVSPAVDVDSRTARVRVQVPNPAGRLKAGMFAQGEILTGAASQAILIPLAAVYRDDSSVKVSYVYMVEGGKARRREVRIGREVAQKLEIVDGLKPGDMLVPERSIELADGVDVKLN